MVEVQNLSEKELLSPQELALKEIKKKPRAKVSGATSAERLKRLATEGHKSAQAEMKRRLEAVKAPTLSERAEQGDEEAQAAVEARKKKRNEVLQQKIAATQKEAETKALAEIREEIAEAPTTKEKKKKYNQNVISRDLHKAAKVNDEIELTEADMLEVEEKPSEPSKETMKEGNRSAWLRLERKRDAYVSAYKKFHKNLDKEITDEEIAEMKPPRFGFLTADRKELRELYNVYNEEKNNEKSRELRQDYEDDMAKQAQENLTKHGRVMFKDTEPGLSPADREAFEESNELDELVEELKRDAHKFSQQKEEPEKKEFTSPLVERLKGMPVKEGLDSILKERAGGIEKRLAEIKKYFVEKNKKMSEDEVHKFLMGQEIKGWFKGKEKQLQKEYKSLNDSPAYKEWLKAKK